MPAQFLPQYGNSRKTMGALGRQNEFLFLKILL